MVRMRSTLIVADSLFVATVVVMNYVNGSFVDNPLFLKLLVVMAFLTCVVRHINYYKITKRIY
jgi:hypothetical protein